ncbi:MAG: hypothetical protein V1897_06475 [Pseudomonadota bacterium]
MNHIPSETPWGLLWRPYHGNIRTVGDFFTRRNLYAIQRILNGIADLNVQAGIKDLLRLAVANIVPACSKQQRHYPGSTFPNMAMPGVLFVPPINEEVNVIKRVLSKQRSLVLGQKTVNECLKDGRILISTQDSRDLRVIPSNRIDYIFTDPPYSGRIQYGELNFIQEAILGMNTEWLKNEIIVNKNRGFTAETWQSRLLEAMKEVFRVLKPGHWISVCFHDSDPSSWVRLQDIMLEAGFLPGDSLETSSMETGWRTLKMHTSEDITKRDLVVNFRKPKPGETAPVISIIGDEDNKTFNEKVCSVICNYLESYPGATKDRIYDEVVIHMVHSGRMEAHDFDGLLRQVAEEVKEPVKKTFFENEDPNLFGTHEVSRWYLKETQFAEVDAAESAKEDGAADKMEVFMTKKLKEQPWLDGVHYSDIFEHYIYLVKDKPRRQLPEWLLDYFYKTDAGTYRLPQSEDEKQLKTEARTKGIHRHIKRFIAYLQQGVAIPSREQPNDATLAEWLRYCKRSSLYEQGKLLYEKGGLTLDNLSEEATVNAEEDYQVCVRMLVKGVSGSENTIKARKKKK